MIKRSIVKFDTLQIADETSSELSFGCNQDWYADEWQRRSGCAPTVASNMFLYLDSKSKHLESDKKPTMQNCLILMNKLWNFITPTSHGVESTERFYRGALKYAESSGIRLCYDFRNVRPLSYNKILLKDLTHFISNQLELDRPVAFLNLDSGEETMIEKWHWVTLVSIEYSEDCEEVYVGMMDNGEIKTVSLTLWFYTTNIGGGFVSFWECEGS